MSQHLQVNIAAVIGHLAFVVFDRPFCSKFTAS